MLRKDSFLLRHKKKIVILSLVLVLSLAGVFFYNNTRKRLGPTVNAAEHGTATVEKGNISNKITGSGTIQSASTKNISSEVSADVLDVKVSVGDKVKAGDVLIELDKSDYETRIRDLNKNISNLSLEVGDSVNKNSTIFQVTNDEYYYITCKVNYNTNLNIKVGDSAKVMLVDTLRNLDGEVSYVSDLKEISDSGIPLQSVEVKIKNPGYTLDGLLATITINTSSISIKAVESVKIISAKSKSIKAQSSGTIVQLNVRNGDYINTGDLVMILGNDDLQDNLNDAKSNLSDAYEDLENEKNNLDFYTIIAPIDGIVTTLNISSGDYVRSESALLTIVNNDNIEFDIEVDELDINLELKKQLVQER